MQETHKTTKNTYYQEIGNANKLKFEHNTKRQFTVLQAQSSIQHGETWSIHHDTNEDFRENNLLNVTKYY